MAKAYLTSSNVELSYDLGNTDSYSIRNMNGEEVSRINGPRTYIYNLKYVSYDPLRLNDFPREINTDITPSNRLEELELEQKNTEVEPKVEEKPKEIPAITKKVQNAIALLEV